MAPKQKPEDMKQKPLTSFFTKGPATPAGTSNGKAQTSSVKRAVLVTKDASKASSSSVTSEPKTPDTRMNEGMKIPSSGASSSGASTPPTSDPIDVDMLGSDEEPQHPPSSVTASKHKRKIVVEDSDEEQDEVKSSGYAPSSPIESMQAKRPRLSKALVYIDEDDDDDDSPLPAVSQRLSRFKKSPAKKGRSRSQASDDDDFIVPDDSEEEAKSVKSSSSRSSRSSRMSSDDEGDFDDFDMDDEPAAKKSKAKKSAPYKSSGSKAAVPLAASSSISGSFLTAAEQRAQGKKDEKKAAESPYSFLQDVKDKDGRRPGEPNYDPRTLLVPKFAWNSFTPFEKQFWEIKQYHYDTILFFQKGKFYELYEDDARIGHQQFDLKLTERVKMCMVGVPEMSFDLWASKFLAKGYKVGRVEQAETALGAEMRMAAEKEQGKGKAKAKASSGPADKIVRRELNKVYTAGTLVDEAFLTDEQAGHCISIFEETTPSKDGTDPDSARKFGICVLDCSTSQFNLSFFEDDVCRTQLETLMRQICPKELVYKKGSLSANTQRLLKVTLPSKCLWTALRTVEGFDYEASVREIKRIYAPGDDESMDDDDQVIFPESVPESIRELAGEKLAIEALGTMIWYLRQLNIDKDILSMKNFNIYDPMKRGQGLTLDGQTLAHLEILRNNEGTEDGSLLKLLNRCVTPFGKRLFRIWLCTPLREVSAINDRLDAVQDIISHPTFEQTFTSVARGIPDLERLVSRIHAKNCRVKDFLKVLTAFKKLSKGLSKLADESSSFDSNSIAGLLRGAPDLLPHIAALEALYTVENEDRPDELLPRSGKDETYDKIVAEIKSLEKSLHNELEKMKKDLGLNLTYWHSAVGNKDIYLVEVPASVKKDKVPSDWVKSGGTKAKTRYVVGALQKRIRQLKEAQENRNTAIKTFKFRVYAQFDTDRSLWLRAVRVFAELDCLFSLAKSSLAIGEPACRPTFVDGDESVVDFTELRHPTLCLSTRLSSFIPNDVKLGGDSGKILLLTGPNMAGKSTVMRMTATGVIMAQLGMLVPASSARLSAVDTIITRMGAYDNMFSHASTFKVELDECCKILRNATPKSLVILDELGRGTSTFDGMAIASAVLHQLATHVVPLTFFATHYGSLTDDFSYHPNVRKMYMSTLVDDEKHELVFLYKLIDGVAESSFGTHVANLAGVPIKVVERADTISQDFAKQFKEKLQIKQEQHASAKMPLVAQADFAYLYKLTTGKLELPEDPIRRREVLGRMKAIVARYVKS
ncbi:muts domain V-domain-containing protein [Panaeolus papilionaceus]|nr:muts domain V-domain-containing protein [Panaeolus papilionaceus]